MPPRAGFSEFGAARGAVEARQRAVETAVASAAAVLALRILVHGISHASAPAVPLALAAASESIGVLLDETE